MTRSVKAIVLAGGGGTRLWPLSREGFPKQFLSFDSGLSLLQKSVQRLLSAPFIDELVVATNKHHLSLVRQQLEKIDPHFRSKIIVEPVRKNTAPAIGFALKYLQEFCGAKMSDAVIVLPSDHLIEPEELFLHAVEQMGELVNTKSIITFGIHPTKPETGYGYIQIGRKFNGLTFEVARFVEKPNQKTAEKYLVDPHFYWNSGIFIFSIETFWLQLGKYAPDLCQFMSGSYDQVMDNFRQMPEISIDYALLEKSQEVLVCPLAVSWSDVGSWDSVYDIMEKDQDQNVKIGQVVAIDTINSLIMGGHRLVSTIGIEDLLVVDTEDALFISKKGASQRVKGLVQELVKKGRQESFLHKVQVHSWGASHLLCETGLYTIQKIQISPKKHFEYSQKDELDIETVSLSGKLDWKVENNQWTFFNLQEEIVEFLLIEKKNASQIHLFDIIDSL